MDCLLRNRSVYHCVRSSHQSTLILPHLLVVYFIFSKVWFAILLNSGLNYVWRWVFLWQFWWWTRQREVYYSAMSVLAAYQLRWSWKPVWSLVSNECFLTSSPIKCTTVVTLFNEVLHIGAHPRPIDALSCSRQTASHSGVCIMNSVHHLVLKRLGNHHLLTLENNSILHTDLVSYAKEEEH